MQGDGSSSVAVCTHVIVAPPIFQTSLARKSKCLNYRGQWIYKQIKASGHKLLTSDAEKSKRPPPRLGEIPCFTLCKCILPVLLSILVRMVLITTFTTWTTRLCICFNRKHAKLLCADIFKSVKIWIKTPFFWKPFYVAPNHVAYRKRLGKMDGNMCMEESLKYQPFI